MTRRSGDGMVRQISNDNENRGTFDDNLIKLPLSIFFQKRKCGERGDGDGARAHFSHF